MASGAAEFCLTSVVHYLAARATWGDLAARFAAVVVQRSPMAAIVAAHSALAAPAHLSGRRLGGPPDGGLVAEYQAAMSWLGLGPSVLVPVAYEHAPAALARGEIDAVADFVDLLPRIRRQGGGLPVRAIPFGIEVYGSGLVAADWLPLDVVTRMRAAIIAALEQQRREPEGGLEELGRRYPDVDPQEALEGWALVEPNIFTGVEPGSMNTGRWRSTVAYASKVHGFEPVTAASVHRPEFSTGAGPKIRAGLGPLGRTTSLEPDAQGSQL